MSEPRILFVHNHPMRFVTVDLALLRERYPVTELYVDTRRVNPLDTLTQVRGHDLILAWFASWYSFLPLLFARLLGRPSILVIGGYDIACMPEIGYGHQRGGLKRWIARGTIRLATQLITNSYYSREEAHRNVGLNHEEVEVVYHGLDPNLFSLSASKEPMAITVGNVFWENLARKGMEPFVRAARHLPDVPFVLIGRWPDEAADYLKRIAPPNVELTGFVPDEKLMDYLHRAKAYVQPSAHEGFGMSVAEAMLCGCIPVVTRAGALPEVVGETGVYLRSAEPEVVAEGIQTALAMNGSRGLAARERIIREFPLDDRQARFFEIIDDVLGRRG